MHVKPLHRTPGRLWRYCWRQRTLYFRIAHLTCGALLVGPLISRGREAKAKLCGWGMKSGRCIGCHRNNSPQDKAHHNQARLNNYPHTCFECLSATFGDNVHDTSMWHFFHTQRRSTLRRTNQGLWSLCPFSSDFVICFWSTTSLVCSAALRLHTLGTTVLLWSFYICWLIEFVIRKRGAAGF